jgi:acyl-CoA dehydrogenase
VVLHIHCFFVLVPSLFTSPVLLPAAQRCYELLLQRSLERQTFGKYLAEHGGLQEIIADCVSDIHAARLMTLDCAAQMDEVGPKRARQAIATIKVTVPQLTMRVADQAIQVFGGAGVGDDFVLARCFTGLRTLRIADGPDAVHKRSVARMELKRAYVKKQEQDEKEEQDPGVVRSRL